MMIIMMMMMMMMMMIMMMMMMSMMKFVVRIFFHSFIRSNLWSALCRQCRIRGAGGSRQVVSYWQSSEFLSCA